MIKYDIHRSTQAQNVAIRAADAFKPSVEAKGTAGITYAEYLEYKKRKGTIK